MDFIIGFPRTYRQHYFIMVVMDKLKKVSHFIPMKYKYSTNDVA